jgi:hypothetical protein
MEAVANAVRVCAVHPAQLATRAVDETREVGRVTGNDTFANDAGLAVARVARAECEPISAAKVADRQVQIILIEADRVLSLRSVALGRR